MKTSYLENPSAGFIPRIAAMGYDTLMLFAIWMLVAAIHAAILGEPGQGDANRLQFTLFPAIVCSTFLFYFWFWTHGGQTLGMKAWRIKVVHENLDDSPVKLLQCVIRMVVGSLSFSCFLLGYLWVYLNSNRDTWHDTASKTRTIRLPKANGLY